MISTHILDTSHGHPAQQVKVSLEKSAGDSWKSIGVEKTNADGRIMFNSPKEAGTYRLIFHVEDYFKSHNIDPFFLNAPVVFRISDTNRNYHIPLLLNPYGYSTYRGS
jgi:5-hydroxyisourate hydrolase